MVELAGIRVWVVSYSYIGGTLQGIPSSTFSAQLETGLEEETTPQSQCAGSRFGTTKPKWIRSSLMSPMKFHLC